MIELRNVTISYPLPDGTRRTVVERLSLRISRGEQVYLIGPTGSGKSSILRLLYMEHSPEYGSVQVGDYRSNGLKKNDIPHLRRSLGVVFQDFQLLPDRSIYENVAFALYATGKNGQAVKDRVREVLARVGLTDKHAYYPHELSGGEQQRVAIARAIANEPWLLLADEPTGNLDPRVSDEIHQLLLDLHRQGMTFVMATHDYRLVRKYPARTLALMNGQVVEVDPETI